MYEKALENPDSLVDVIDVDFRDDPSFGSFGSVARDAYEFTLNKEFPYHMFKTSDLVGTIHKSEETPALYPRLAAKLGDCESWWEARLSGGSSAEE